MKKTLIIMALAFLLVVVSPFIALAADISGAEWRSRIIVTNTGAVATNVPAVFTLDTDEMIDRDMLGDNATGATMRTATGTDIVFMPGSTDKWCTWVAEIGAGGALSQYLFSKGVTGGRIRYFPDEAGMVSTDNETLELGDNFTVEQSGWWDTGNGANKTAVYKEGAFKTNVSDTVSGNITSTVSGAGDWVSPTGHTDPDTNWGDDAQAYNDNTADYATNAVGGTAWGNFLELNRASFDVSGVRYYASGENADITQIDVDVYSGGDWHHIYQGTFTHSTWETKIVGKEGVTKARVRLYNSVGAGREGRLHDFDFRDIAETSVTATGISSGEHRVTTECVPEGALYFNGTTDYVDCNNGASLNFGDNLTIEVWIKPDVAFTGYTGIVGKWKTAGNDRCYWLAGNAGDNFRFWVSKDGTDSNGYASCPNGDTDLKHIVGTFDGTTITIYKNGVPSPTDNYPNVINQEVALHAWIGASGDVPDRFFEGTITEVRMYSRALSPTEVVEHYNGVYNDESDLEALWRFNDGDGATTADESGNANTGTIIGADWRGGYLTLSIDGDEKDADYTPSVLDTNNDWAFLQYNVMPYMEYHEITVDGVQQQRIEWEYDTTFTDLSGQGHDTTPTFRATSADNITAVVGEQVSLLETENPATAPVEGWDMITDVPDEPVGLYTEGGTSFPWSNLIINLAGYMRVPVEVISIPIALLSAMIMGLVAFGGTHSAQMGVRGSLWIQCMVTGGVMILWYIGGGGVLPGWVLIPFGLWAIVMLLWRNPFSPASG